MISVHKPCHLLRTIALYPVLQDSTSEPGFIIPVDLMKNRILKFAIHECVRRVGEELILADFVGGEIVVPNLMWLTLCNRS